MILKQPAYPSLYQVNTRVRLTELSAELGFRASLDDIPDSELDGLKAMGFDWIWLLSVWTTGQLARKVSLENPDFRRDYDAILPDLTDDDIAGSGFAIYDYKVHPALGGDEALARLRVRLKERGLKLMLDFVPNHLAPDHHWVETHPEYFVSGTEEDLRKAPGNYSRVKRSSDEIILAYGRDPYFSGWPDTVQLDFSNPATIEAMNNELLRIAGQCDGVRCDMSMLILPDVFERTWGRKALPFWPGIIQSIHELHPGFCFLAEVYWDMEWDLQQLGFDFTYDKRLYDRLREGHARPVREHFYAGAAYQDKLARFLENHDEPRAAKAFENKMHEAAAIITFFSTGLRFFHEGQFVGKKIRISAHLVRGPKEPVEIVLLDFYARLLNLIRRPVFREGQWRLLNCLPAWEGNDSWDAFIPFTWQGTDGRNYLVIVNYSPGTAQCYVHLDGIPLAGHQWQLQDLMGDAKYDRDGDNLQTNGLYLDMQPWQYHVFELSPSVIP